MFQWDTRVYFEDTDSGGVVYHANYLKFMERARTEWLRSLGLNQTKLKKEDKVMFVVRKINIQYKIAARFNDELVVHTDRTKTTDYSIILKQNIFRDTELITQGQVEIVCINSNLFKPMRIPKMTKQLMETI
mgnify:FL=1